jgi:hypothetical protein
MHWLVRRGEEERIRGRDWAPPAGNLPGVNIVQRWGCRLSAVWAATPGETGDLFVKWYGLRHPWEGLKYALKPSRPAAEWRMNRMLTDLGVPVVDCLAMGERRVAGWWRGGVLVLKAVSPPVTLSAYLKTARDEHARQAVGMVADLVARFHGLGCCHHDLHGDNVLVEQDQGRPVRLLLVDLHETTRHRSMRPGLWLDDLARLNGYTPGDRRLRLRFWVRYAAARGLARKEFRGWLGRIEQSTRQLWERHFRKRGVRIELY